MGPASAMVRTHFTEALQTMTLLLPGMVPKAVAAKSALLAAVAIPTIAAPAAEPLYMPRADQAATYAKKSAITQTDGPNAKLLARTVRAIRSPSLPRPRFGPCEAPSRSSCTNNNPVRSQQPRHQAVREHPEPGAARVNGATTRHISHRAFHVDALFGEQPGFYTMGRRLAHLHVEAGCR